MKEIIDNTAAYIRFLTGEKVSLVPLDTKLKRDIPMFLLGAYELYEGVLMGKQICFAFVDKDADTTPAQYPKRAQALMQATSLLPVFVMANVASYNAQRLTRHRVNYIVPGKLFFLPALLMDLGNNKTDAPLPESIPATAQLILLYHLEVALLHDRTGKEIAGIVGASPASVSRAIRWLVANGMAEVEGGKSKNLRFARKGRALWEYALNYLKNPVLKTVRTDATLQGLICGQNALAEYEMLVETSHEMVAIGPKEYRTIKQDTDPLYGENEIQVWMYSPQNLTKVLWVDKLSLYLSMRDNADERVQKALDTMIGQMKWLED